MEKYVFGVDIGGTTIKTGIFKQKGELAEKWEIPTDTSSKGENILRDISVSLKNKIVDMGIKKNNISGIGLGIPGPVTNDGVVKKCVNLGWGEFNVEKKLSELTGLYVKSGNDANVAALGEHWQGSGKGCMNMVMVTLGTGVGGGIILNGKMVCGAHGSGGEIGHIPVEDNETEPCGCGNYGCLEQYASATGVVRLTKRILNASSSTSCLRNMDITAKSVFDAAKNGDNIALEVLDVFGNKLGKALAAVAVIADPQVFVLGGGVSKAGDIITDTVKKHYEKYAFHSVRNTDFRLAGLGNDAGIYGGAALIINNLS